jgi:membrane-associated protein
VTALTGLQVSSMLSYAIAFIIPGLDAIVPVLPSETVIIALGVATAGSADPRIALLIACAAAGAFAGDNLCYLLGRRFGPRVERRFFSSGKGARRRAWAERSLQRFGMQIIVVCRFVPGGRTAVTLCCGIIGYPRRRFMPATAVAGMVWAVYSFFLGRLGGKTFEDKPWAGFLVAFGVSIALSGAIEAVRRIRSRGHRATGHPAPRGRPRCEQVSPRPVRPNDLLRPRREPGTLASARSRERHFGQVDADDPGQDQADRHQLQRGRRIAEEEHARDRGPGRADPRPDRVCGSHLEIAQRDSQQREAHQGA